jgi:hypothetical protein
LGRDIDSQHIGFQRELVLVFRTIVLIIARKIKIEEGDKWSNPMREGRILD